MSDCSLNSLDPRRFMEIVPNREKKIAMASNEYDVSETYANKLARSLHPGVQHMVVYSVIEHNPIVRSYVLKMVDPLARPAYFNAGQYISVQIDADGKKLCRPYSISSSPEDSDKGFYRITVKLQEGGLATEHIFNNWSQGTYVDVSEPMGVFTYEPLRDSKHIVGVAGGSGVTPFMSLAKAISEGSEDCSLTLLYGNKDEESILMKEELDSICSKCSLVKVNYIIGNITSDHISQALSESPCGNNTSVFVCGSQNMYKYIKTQLDTVYETRCMDKSLIKKYIRYEYFGEIYSKDSSYDCPKYVNISVKIKDKKVSFTASCEDTILRSLEKNGIPALSGCRSGECGYCRSKLISGRVYMPQQSDGRRLADNKNSYIHPCCSFPMSDIELEVPTVK